jgi:hypothetical protein
MADLLTRLKNWENVYPEDEYKPEGSLYKQAHAALVKAMDAMEVSVRHEPKGLYPDHVPNYWLLKRTLEELKQMINETDIEAMAPEKLSNIVLVDTEEQEGGGLKITYTLDDDSTRAMAAIGVEFILYCAAAKLDIQDALKHILALAKTED